MQIGLMIPSPDGASNGLVVNGEASGVASVPGVGDGGAPYNTSAVWDYLDGDLQSHIALGTGGYPSGSGNFRPGS